MPHSSAHSPGAGRADFGRAGRRPSPASPADRLSQLSSRLDDLIREVSCVPSSSHRETERRIAEAEEIAGEIRAVFRAPSKAENPPLKRVGTGAWW